MTFNLIDTGEWIDPQIYFLPEEDAYDINFKQCGYDSLLIFPNISVVIWMYIAHLFFSVTLYGPIWVIHKCSGKLVSIKKTLAAYFFWNGLIRLTFESTFEIALAAILNLSTVDWNSPFNIVQTSTALSIIGLIIISLIYPVLTLKYFRNFSILAEDTFKIHYGAGLEGTKY